MDEDLIAQLRQLYQDQVAGLREQTLATWRTYLQAIAETRDLKGVVLEERDLRVKRQRELDAKLAGISRRLDDQDRVLRWIRRIAIVAAIAAVATGLIYAGTLF